MIRVGPPQQGTIDGLDLGVSQKFDKDFHKDFAKELRLAKSKDNNNAKADTKEKPNQDSDQVSKKSSGGIKKKMAKAKDDDSDAEKTDKDVKAVATISNIMVSNEGELEIADNEENLPEIAPDENIQNMQAQLFAQLGANGEATSKAELGEEAQTFQYLTSTEKALLADIQGDAQMQAAVADSAVDATQSADLEVQQEAESLGVAGQFSQQEALGVEDKKATALESKAFDVLSKENASAGAESKFSAQALAMTKNSEQQKGEGQNKGSDSSQSQTPTKFDTSNDLAAQVSALHAGQRNSFQSHLGAAAGTAGLEVKPEAMTDATKDANIREIMNQAKFLVTKGGGEMTVRMTPEGMGEVQLKVALDNGKINIEMNSQDKSVKKMIEDSLSDLKSSLASHQMHVEHVKINNVTAVDTNNQSNFQSDANSSNSSFQNRQQQEMSFQNMTNSDSGRRGNQERGTTSFQQSVQAPVVKPMAKANAYVAANKGSSVNMVA